VDLGQPIAYAALGPGVSVYSADGQAIGKVAHVLADEGQDVFDGIVIGEHVFGHDHRFADADDVDAIYEQGVLLKLDRTACERLPKPSANPAVMRDDPAESKANFRHERLMRAWDRISGND
jgi:uncharacterized protein YrrD